MSLRVYGSRRQVAAGQRRHQHRCDIDRLIIEERRQPDVAVVEPDHVTAGCRRDAGRILVPHDHLGAEAHDQQERWIAPAIRTCHIRRRFPSTAMRCSWEQCDTRRCRRPEPARRCRSALQAADASVRRTPPATACRGRIRPSSFSSCVATSVVELGSWKRRVSLTSIWEWIRFCTRSGRRMSVNRCCPVFAAGLDQQVTGPEHPLEDRSG